MSAFHAAALPLYTLLTASPQYVYGYLMDKKPITVRIDAALYKRLRAATIDSKDKYAPNLTDIVEDGIERALKARERKK